MGRPKIPSVPTVNPTPPSVANSDVQSAALKQRSGGGIAITILTGPGGLEAPADTTAKQLTGM